MKKRILFASLRERLYVALKEDIILNKYKPGAELQIHKLAEEFGVSSTPIREALMRLEGAGLVVSIPNRGVQVAPICLADVKNVYEIRCLLEPHVAKTAARLCEREEVDKFYRELQEIMQEPTDLTAYINADLELSQLLTRYLDNALLKEILEQIDHHSIRIRYLAESKAGGLEREIVEQVTKEHLKILDGVRNRDEEQAAAATRQHLANAKARALQALAKVLDS
jgi:DNA-binding GntR family transcriptional regulator